MMKIEVHPEKATDFSALPGLCPFGAIEVQGKNVEINAACRACLLCVKKGPPGVFTVSKTSEPGLDKSLWRGITVVVETGHDGIIPVSLELIGEARNLAAKVGHPVYALLAGDSCQAAARELAHYGVDAVYVYESRELSHFRPEPFTAAIEDHVNEVKPAVLLVGGTQAGRSLAPRVAARFRTGLTADCTSLDIQKNTDLDQIRPAFGGNIMAHINTSRHRPQLATVRPKIFSAPERASVPAGGEIFLRNLPASRLSSRIEVLESQKKSWEKKIEDADIIVAVGRGFIKKEDLELARRLALLLHAEVAGTRSTIEAGWIDAKRQIGLSGRTVKPRLIITIGISGAVQFAAGMKGSEAIISINSDPHAPIFSIAHYAVVGDLYEILPRLIAKLEKQAEKSQIANEEVFA